MCGQTAAFALMREGVRNMRIVDRAARGREGPWGTYARMDMLRSPKHLTGPDLGFPALTFRAWYEAQHGAEGWQRLYKVATDGLAAPTCCGCATRSAYRSRTASRYAARSGCRRRARRAATGPQGAETIYARKVVLAGGRDGSGAPHMPAFPSLLDGSDGRAGPRVPLLRRHRLRPLQGRQDRRARAPAPRPSTTRQWRWRRVRPRRTCSCAGRICRRSTSRNGPRFPGSSAAIATSTTRRAGGSTPTSSPKPCRRRTSRCCAATATRASPCISASPGST